MYSWFSCRKWLYFPGWRAFDHSRLSRSEAKLAQLGTTWFDHSYLTQPRTTNPCPVKGPRCQMHLNATVSVSWRGGAIGFTAAGGFFIGKPWDLLRLIVVIRLITMGFSGIQLLTIVNHHGK